MLSWRAKCYEVSFFIYRVVVEKSRVGILVWARITWDHIVVVYLNFYTATSKHKVLRIIFFTTTPLQPPRETISSATHSLGLALDPGFCNTQSGSVYTLLFPSTGLKAIVAQKVIYSSEENIRSIGMIVRWMEDHIYSSELRSVYSSCSVRSVKTSGKD